MQFSNPHNIPQVLVDAMLDDDYTRGDAELSVTQLISPPRIVILQERFKHNMVVDIATRVPSLMGRVLHKICEQYAPPEAITEERLFATVDGMKISGAVDLQIPKPNGKWAIHDYKLTKSYAAMDEKIEWEQQLNIYAHLMSLNGREVDELKIVAILKDWQKKLVDVKAGYPPCQVMTIPIRLWTPEEQVNFTRSQIVNHRKAREALDKGLPIEACSETARWVRDETWALMKEGRNAAIKLYDNPYDAEVAAAEKGDEFFVTYRPGTPTRCAGNYCGVAEFCRVWRSDPRYTP